MVAVGTLEAVPRRQSLDVWVLLVAVEESPCVLGEVGRVDRCLAYGRLDDPVEDGVEQPVLAPEVVVDLRLVGPGRVGDPVDTRAGDPAGRELASVEDMSEKAFRDQVEAVFFGTVHTTKAALPVLRAQRGGHIINVTSVGSRMATPGLSAYQSAKWATAGFSLVLAAEVAPLGIRVTSLEPGGMATDWAGSSMTVPQITEPYRDTVGAAAAMHDSSWRPLGDPAKVAQVVLQVANMDDPPVRLLLGSEAYAYATAAAKEQLASDERWRELSRSTDRDDATPAERDPLGTHSAAAV